MDGCWTPKAERRWRRERAVRRLLGADSNSSDNSILKDCWESPDDRPQLKRECGAQGDFDKYDSPSATPADGQRRSQDGPARARTRTRDRELMREFAADTSPVSAIARIEGWLAREGIVMNQKKLRRLYKEEGLSVETQAWPQARY